MSLSSAHPLHVVPPDVLSRNAKLKEEKASVQMSNVWQAPVKTGLEDLGVDTVALQLFCIGGLDVEVQGPLKPVRKMIPTRELSDLNQQCIVRTTGNDAEISQGRTPLFVAASNGHVEIVQYLISAGASVNRICGNEREIALHEAARAGHAKVCHALLEEGSSVDFPNKAGRTPLIMAAGENRWDVVEILLAANANPNAADQSGSTALHIAARLGYEKVVKLLLLGGANSLKTDSRGRTALQRAREGGNKEENCTVQLLVAAGKYAAAPSPAKSQHKK